MAKSPMAMLKKKSASQNTLSPKGKVVEVDLVFELKLKGKPYPEKFNLRDWCHLNCDPKNGLVVPSRISRMQTLRKWVTREIKNQSEETTNTKLRVLKRYISFCDIKGFDPFTKSGYLAYAGNDGELWRQVCLAVEPKDYKFLYHDGEEMGIAENVAFLRKCALDYILPEVGFDTSEWQATLHRFESTSNGTANEPYTAQEWRTMIRRVQYYFFSLATELIAYRDDNPITPPPQVLKGVAIGKIGSEEITIAVGNGRRTGGGVASAFNQCMSAGYVLFAYYTAFNDTVIQDVRHPLRTITGVKEGRTTKHVQVKAYKGRSAKDVKALFSELDESQHPEAKSESDTGFVVANINKRDTNGIMDGIAFIETLKLLSQAYNDESYGPLIYMIDKKGNHRPARIHRGMQILGENLGLLRECRGDLADHLVASFTEVLENQQLTEFTAGQSEAVFTIMRKEVISLNSAAVKLRAIPLAVAAVSCMTEIPLKNILMPLHYSVVDAEGNITISFSYLDDTEGSFKVGAKYQPFFESVESYAMSLIPLQKNMMGKTRGGIGSHKTPFLFPLGAKNRTHQWEGAKLPITKNLLLRCGIGNGDFYLSVNSSRIRATHSDLEYKSEENGFTARQILQHSITTQQIRYINGHPVENNKQMSQGMLGLMKIAEGMTRDEAVNEVKKILDIPVMSYEQWKARRIPTNPNGVACDGKIDLVQGKNEHYAAQKFAEHEGVIGENQDITCYQYDLCVFCKNAQLVDDPHAIYKLLSFLDALKESIDLFPSRADFIEKKIERFELHIEDLPHETLEQAGNLFAEQGRYALFKSNDAIAQYL